MYIHWNVSWKILKETSSEGQREGGLGKKRQYNQKEETKNKMKKGGGRKKTCLVEWIISDLSRPMTMANDSQAP